MPHTYGTKCTLFPEYPKFMCLLKVSEHRHFKQHCPTYSNSGLVFCVSCWRNTDFGLESPLGAEHLSTMIVSSERKGCQKHRENYIFVRRFWSKQLHVGLLETLFGQHAETCVFVWECRALVGQSHTQAQAQIESSLE